LTHRHPAHFTYAFVMPVAQARDGLSREAPRFAPITTLQGIPVLLGIPGTNP